MAKKETSGGVEKIFFQSSMPRSGSTLLQNILGQNPDFYVTPTSGALELIYGARNNYTNNPEFKAQDADLMKKSFLSFCRHGLEGFYKPQTERKYVVDKSRGWGIHYPWLKQFLPYEPKVICMVRNMKDILCSMEKKFRSTPERHQSIINWETMQGATTASRMDIWLASPPVGLALNRIKQMETEGISPNILFIKYEDLCLYPDQQMRKIYDYLEVDYYEHDFDNVEQITVEDDEVYGVFGDHKIRKKVSPSTSDARNVLGADIVNWIMNTPILKEYHQKFGYTH